MRTLVLVAVVGALLLLQSVLLGLLPAYLPPPAVGLLVALHVGLSPRWSLGGGVVAGFAMGYLFDLIAGAPSGTHALVYSLVALGTGLVSSRLLVRGAIVRALVSFAVTLVAALLVVAVRAWVTPGAGWGGLRFAPLEALFTALAAPALMRLFERLDGRFQARSRVGLLSSSSLGASHSPSGELPLS
jgi:rod shape-determining protein MreD